MKLHEFRIGTGIAPKQIADLKRYTKIEKLVGLKGEIWCHLYGNWWEIVSPKDVNRALLNWRLNQPIPVVKIWG